MQKAECKIIIYKNYYSTLFDLKQPKEAIFINDMRNFNAWSDSIKSLR